MLIDPRDRIIYYLWLDHPLDMENGCPWCRGKKEHMPACRWVWAKKLVEERWGPRPPCH